MILAAGLGTRLKPFTENHPKALAIVNGKTLLQRNIEYLLSFGINQIIINVHHFAGQIIDAIQKHNGYGAHITISDESDKVLETGGGLMKASGFLKDSDPFLLMNVDILTDLNIHLMVEKHRDTGALATLAVTRRTTSRYFLFDENDRLCGWRNVNTGEQRISLDAANFFPKAFSGIHIIRPEIFSVIKRTGKFSMVDVYLDLANRKVISSFDHTGNKFADVGTVESLARASRIFA